MTFPDNQALCDNLIHNIIILRKQYGLTKKTMAKLLGISLYSLNRLERGTCPGGWASKWSSGRRRVLASRSGSCLAEDYKRLPSRVMALS